MKHHANNKRSQWGVYGVHRRNEREQETDNKRFDRNRHHVRKENKINVFG